MTVPRIRGFRTLAGIGLSHGLRAALTAMLDALTADENSLERYSKSEIHMAVDFEIVVYAADPAAAERAFAAGFRRVAELNRKLSDYDAESELSRLSASAGSGNAVRVSDDLFAVLNASQQLSARSDGAFDITCGPLTKLWRRARRQKELPSPERIAEARAAVGHENLHLNENDQTATLSWPGMRLDLGGIAKGFAADEALAAVQATGIPRALVRASGDIVAGEPPPGEHGWNVGLARRPSRHVHFSGPWSRFHVG